MADLLVQTAYGPVLGFRDTYPLREQSSASLVADGNDGGRPVVQKWLGVRYAQAKRWQRPTAPESWTEPRKAHEFGTMFPQPPSGSEKLYAHQEGVLLRRWVQASEDSHTVNVFASQGIKSGDNVAVLAFIYGGSLNNGSSERGLFDPTEWIRAQQAEGRKFIVVSGNYRTNIFGFMSSPDLLAADPDGLSGNYGLYDCVSMLEWIQSNIPAFGGDPNNVTVFGESAGAFLISYLLVSGRKLFQKAIMQSGAAGTMLIRHPHESYPSHSDILNTHGPGGATSEARLNALRSVPADDLLAAHNASYRWGGVSLTLEEGPKATWTGDALARMQAGDWDPWIKRVIIGTNENEGTIFVAGMKLNNSAGFEGHVARFPSSVQAAIKAKYLAPFDGRHPKETTIIDSPMSRILGDHLFVDPAWQQTKALAGDNETGLKMERVWLYRCRAEVDRMSKGVVPGGLGSMHTIDLPLVFNVSSMWEPDSKEARSAAALSTAWANFAISGNPDPNWQPFTLSNPSWLAFADDGTTENESLADFESGMIDWTGKGSSSAATKEKEVLGETNE